MNLKNRPACNFSGKKLLITGLFLSLFITSCVVQSDLEYLNGNEQIPAAYDEADFPGYRIKPNDALYIQINSIDDAASNVFAQPGSNFQQTLDPYGAYMNSYTVDEDGDVLLPVIGKISVAGKTTAEVSDLIRDAVVNILSLPTVTVRLVNMYISVLGEVRNPGHFVFSQDKLTIFNALAIAGDISDFGNRKEVILTRSENGKNTRVTIDLTKADILSSPYYVIQPNDLIYVKPMKKRIWGMREFPFATVFSTITTAIVVYTFILQQ